MLRAAPPPFVRRGAPDVPRVHAHTPSLARTHARTHTRAHTRALTHNALARPPAHLRKHAHAGSRRTKSGSCAVRAAESRRRLQRRSSLQPRATCCTTAVAGGTGVTPFVRVLRELTAGGRSAVEARTRTRTRTHMHPHACTQVWVVTSNRCAADVLFAHELARMHGTLSTPVWARARACRARARVRVRVHVRACMRVCLCPCLCTRAPTERYHHATPRTTLQRRAPRCNAAHDGCSDCTARLQRWAGVRTFHTLSGASGEAAPWAGGRGRISARMLTDHLPPPVRTYTDRSCVRARACV